MSRPIIGVWIVASFACAGAALHAQESVTAPGPQRAASQPLRLGSPAVQAAENARTPGELQSEKRPLRQITVPLKRKATTDDAAAARSAAAASRPSVDDATASCLARKTARERAHCSQPEPKVAAEKAG